MGCSNSTQVANAQAIEPARGPDLQMTLIHTIVFPNGTLTKPRQISDQSLDADVRARHISLMKRHTSGDDYKLPESTMFPPIQSRPSGSINTIVRRQMIPSINNICESIVLQDNSTPVARQTTIYVGNNTKKSKNEQPIMARAEIIEGQGSPETFKSNQKFSFSQLHKQNIQNQSLVGLLDIDRENCLINLGQSELVKSPEKSPLRNREISLSSLKRNSNMGDFSPVRITNYRRRLGSEINILDRIRSRDSQDLSNMAQASPLRSNVYHSPAGSKPRGMSPDGKKDTLNRFSEKKHPSLIPAIEEYEQKNINMSDLFLVSDPEMEEVKLEKPMLSPQAKRAKPSTFTGYPMPLEPPIVPSSGILRIRAILNQLSIELPQNIPREFIDRIDPGQNEQGGFDFTGIPKTKECRSATMKSKPVRSKAFKGLRLRNE